jgi:hypothetical protein
MENYFGILLQKRHHREAPDCPIPTHILFCTFMKVRTGYGPSTQWALASGRRQPERKQQ